MAGGFFSLSFLSHKLYARFRISFVSVCIFHLQDVSIISLSFKCQISFPCLFSPGLSSPYHHTNDSHTTWHWSTPVDLTHSLYINDINRTAGNSSLSLIFALSDFFCSFLPSVFLILVSWVIHMNDCLKCSAHHGFFFISYVVFTSLSIVFNIIINSTEVKSACLFLRSHSTCFDCDSRSCARFRDNLL